MNIPDFGISRGRQPLREPWDKSELIQERLSTIALALEPGTQAAYVSHMRSYLYFCELHEIHPNSTEDTLSLYAVWAAHHGISPRSLSSYLTGICSYLRPYYPDAGEARTSFLVSRTLQGLHKRFSQPTSRKRPLLQRDLYALRAGLDLNLYEDSLFWAVVLVGWCNLHRLGELAPGRVDPSTMRKTIKRDSWTVGRLWSTYVLPYHKADRLYNSNLCLLRPTGGILCPVWAMQRFLAHRDALHPPSGPLFLNQDGRVPTRSSVVRRLQAKFGREVGGHSLRAGGATWLALQGMRQEHIQRLGRWSSTAFEAYIREHPVLIHALAQTIPLNSLLHHSYNRQ